MTQQQQLSNEGLARLVVSQFTDPWSGRLDDHGARKCVLVLQAAGHTLTLTDFEKARQSVESDRRERDENPNYRKQWQLYSGAPNVAYDDLNGALKKAVASVKKNPGTDLEKLCAKFLGPVFSKYNDHGADDTEPRSFAYQVLERVQNRYKTW